MRVNLVSGGLGFVGSHLVDDLIQLGEFVICLDDISSGRKSNIKRWQNSPNFQFIEGNILDYHNIKFERLWHLACPASPEKYLIDPILTSEINFQGTLNLLNMAKKQKAKVLFASSSEVYGNCLQIPQDENYLGFINTKSLRSCYSHGKRIAETLCFDFQRIYDMDIKIARIFNTYGPRLKRGDGRVISNFINQGLKGDPITIFGNGLQTRSFCYVSDTINALILFMESDFNGVLNIGNEDEISIIELAKLIDKMIDNAKKYKFHEKKVDETIRRCPSIKLAKQIINWEPKVNLDEGLKNTINFFKK